MASGFHALGSRIRAVATGSSNKAWKIASLVTLGLSALLLGTVLYVGPYPQRLFGHDVFVYYSALWKMICGVRPHVDFYCTHGVLIFFFPLLGAMLTGVNDYCLATGSVLFGLLLTLAAWPVLRVRTSPFVAAAYTIYTLLVALGTQGLKWPFYYWSYSSLYNKQCYAILLILMAQALLPRQSCTRRAAILDALICGMLAGGLFFFKITYFFAGVGLLVFALCAQPALRAQFRMIIAGILAVWLPCLIYLQGNLFAYIRDIGFSMSTRKGTLDQELVLRFAGAVVPVALILFLVLLFTGKNRPRELILPLLFLGLTAGESICILLTNLLVGPNQDIPLMGGAALLYIAWTNRANSISAWKQCFLLLILLGIASPYYFSNTASIVDTAIWRTFQTENTPQSEVIFSPRMRHLVIRGWGGGPPSDFAYAEKLNDGLALLSKYATEETKVETLDFVNPFPFIAILPPTKAPLSWLAGYTFNVNQFPPFEEAFGNPDILLLPKYPSEPVTADLLWHVYRKQLKSQYEFEEESKCWFLWKKR